MNRSNKTPKRGDKKCSAQTQKGNKFSSYCDYSKIDAKTANDEAFWVKQKVATKVPPFPATLHMILSDPQNESMITWLPHGRAWKIVNKKEFEKILPRYFRHEQMSSFTRQLRGYGFQKLPSGLDVGAYYHECFLRGMPHLCQSIKRSVNKNPRIADDKECSPPPDFYQMARENPLPDDPQFEMKKRANTVSSVHSSKLKEKQDIGNLQNASADTNIQCFNRPNSQEINFDRVASNSTNNFKSVPSSMSHIMSTHAFSNNSFATAYRATFSPQISDANISPNQCIIDALVDTNLSTMNPMTPIAGASMSLQQPNTSASSEQINLNVIAKLAGMLGASSTIIENKRHRNELIFDPASHAHPQLCIHPPVLNTPQQLAAYETIKNIVKEHCAPHNGDMSALQNKADAGILDLLVTNMFNTLDKQSVTSTNKQIANPPVPNFLVATASKINNTNIQQDQPQSDNLVLRIIQQILNCTKNFTR